MRRGAFLVSLKVSHAYTFAFTYVLVDEPHQLLVGLADLLHSKLGVLEVLEDLRLLRTRVERRKLCEAGPRVMNVRWTSWASVIA